MSPDHVPDPDKVLLTGAGPTGDGGYEFGFRDGEEFGVIHVIAAHLAEMMKLDSDKPLNCVQMEVQPAGKPTLRLTMQRAGGKSPLALKAEAQALLQRVADAIDAGKPRAISSARSAIRKWLAAQPGSVDA